MKYVRVANSQNIENPIIYYQINDFKLDTIKALPFYKEPFDCFILLEAEMDEDNVLNITNYYQLIYYGKRITANKIKELVGNNPKYALLLEELNDADYDEATSLFVAPDLIYPNILVEKKEITIEEFDPEIKLDYDRVFKAFKKNSIMASLYAAKYNMLLYCFSQFFRALQNVYYNIQDLNVLFELYKFDFTKLGYKDIKEIKKFLDLYGYFDSLDENGLYLLSQYKKYTCEILEDRLGR